MTAPVAVIAEAKVEHNPEAMAKQSQEDEEAKKLREAELKKEEEARAQKDKEQRKLKDDIVRMAEQFDCGICYMIMHQAVSLMPCLHTYCGGCFSDWIKRGQKECPNCREGIIMVKKNATLNSTIESYLTVNPDMRRSEAEIKELESKNIFKNDIVRCQNNQPSI